MNTAQPEAQEKRKLHQRFGLVEQLQVVASTAVVVAMITIISIYIITGREFTYIDLLTIITVGLFGFLTVIFALRYGRKLDEQRRELVAINTISEAISHSVRPKVIFMNALKTVVNLLDADYGWIYLNKNDKLLLEYHEGTSLDVIAKFEESKAKSPDWRKPVVKWQGMKSDPGAVPPQLRRIGVRVWISQPLETSNGFAGVLVFASKDIRKFDEKQMNLLSVFVSQIEVALDNAQLFEKVRESEQLYADLYEHSPDMYHIIDRNGTIISCNQTEVDLLGYTKDELIGSNVRILYPEENRSEISNLLKTIFEQQKNLTGHEERIQRKDGSLLDVSINTSLMYENGVPIKLRVVMRDISETKMMQEKLSQIQRIDSLGNLASGIAHDFNNVLVSVLSAASIMKRKMKEDDQWFEYVEMIESSARRGGALTRQLLTFARQSNVTFHPVDVNEVVRETVKLMERSLDKSIKMHVDLTRNFAVVEGDERQLQQVLMNLILNARDAMPGGGKVTLSSSIESLAHGNNKTPFGKAGKYLRIQVKDTGIGMNSEIQEKIFEPFFTTKDSGKGTGLGLSVVYGIISKHKGGITVDSEPENGSVFNIYIPLFDFDVRPSTKKIKSKEKVTGGSEHVLVIEDETPVGRMIRDMLSDFGYNITVCNSGEQGLRELRVNERKYDLLILDLNMPNVSGREVLQQLREFNEMIPVIISTGYGDHILDEQNIRPMTQGYIQKPYDEYEIGRLVRRVLNERKAPTVH